MSVSVHSLLVLIGHFIFIFIYFSLSLGHMVLIALTFFLAILSLLTCFVQCMHLTLWLLMLQLVDFHRASDFLVLVISYLGLSCLHGL